MVFGNISIKPGIKVERLLLPEDMLKNFIGPRFGREGLRRRLRISNRPLICTALKPMELSASELAEKAYRFARDGIDIIKDDHGLADQVFSPFTGRVKRCAEAVAKANAETGGSTIYMPNITAPFDRIRECCETALREGAGGFLICPGLCGINTMRYVTACDEFDVLVMAHPAFSGSFVTSTENGLSHYILYGQLMRPAGAEFLSSYLKPKCRIGVAWSRTVSSMLSYVKPSQAHPDCRINELAGTYLAPHIPYSVSRPLAEKLNIHLESIPVPVLLKSEEKINIILQEELIRTAPANALEVDVALVGIGNISSTSSLARTGYISREHMDEIRLKKAVGDILMRYFDSRGRHFPMSFEDRIVSLKWEEIMKLSFVMAMAFGAQKIEPIRGALRGGIIHGLITDRETALQLLDEAAGDERKDSGMDNGIPGPSPSGP